MIILHGDNQILSRQQFLSLKTAKNQSGFQVVELNGQDMSLPDLVNSLGTSSLFGQTPSVFIENLFSRRPSHAKEEIIAYLKNNPQADIQIFENKDVSAQLKEIPAANIRLFPLPKHIFNFLDRLDLDSFHKSVSVSPVEQVFASLVTRVHKNILIQPSGKSAGYISDLLAIDFAQKTSSSPYGLQTALELWILSL